jgi:hypothetical protein
MCSVVKINSFSIVKGGLTLPKHIPEYGLVMYSEDGTKPVYGFKVTPKKNNDIMKLFAEEARRCYAKPNGKTFEQTQYDYNGCYD